MKTISINKKYMPEHIKTEIIRTLDKNTYQVTHYYMNTQSNEIYKIVYPNVEINITPLSHTNALPFDSSRILQSGDGTIFDFIIED